MWVKSQRSCEENIYPDKCLLYIFIERYLKLEFNHIVNNCVLFCCLEDLCINFMISWYSIRNYIHILSIHVNMADTGCR